MNEEVADKKTANTDRNDLTGHCMSDDDNHSNGEVKKEKRRAKKNGVNEGWEKEPEEERGIKTERWK